MPALPYKPGDVIRHAAITLAEGASYQAGMNFRPGGRTSIFLMSRRPGAPYDDRVEKDGRVLIYEGHNAKRLHGEPSPETIDQPASTPKGTPTQNGRFLNAARLFKARKAPAEPIHVYEKIRDGMWVYNGVFRLVDAWQEQSAGRKVYKYRLLLADDQSPEATAVEHDVENTRMIPSLVKQEVWKRDKGRCRQCGSNKNLHFDHIIPWSRGGSSLTADNIQLLCAKHNLAKHDRIE